MATELQEEKLNQPAQDTAAAPDTAAAQSPEQPAPPAAAAQKPEEQKKKREFLIPLLTVLLILLGIGEAVFWGCFGFASYRNSLAQARYEQQQKSREEQRAAAGLLGGSAYGPNLKVENGTVTWEREKWISQGSSLTDPPKVNRREDGLRLSWLSVPPIPYDLAEMAEDMEPPAETEDLPAQPSDGQEAPTGA